LLIDKPVGPTSFDVVRRVRQQLKIKRAGHAGTLDPLASGLMLVCTGRFTKLCGYLADADKVYDIVITLGGTTATDDSEGPILTQSATDHLEETSIRAAIASFVGPIQQVPPKYSAIKIEGQRAYAKSRADEDFEIAARTVFIREIAVQKIELPHVSLRVTCGKGTYMRSLARDLGEKLGVGGFATAIRRIKIANFCIDSAHPLTDFTHSDLVVGPAMAGPMSLVAICEAQAAELRLGRKITGFSNAGDAVMLAHNLEDLVALVKPLDGYLVPVRVI
jgi:tRNA pseudouridine55 synthase